MTDDIKAYYDAAAEKTAEEWYGNNILLPTIKDFLSILPPKPRILDLGCGPGYESMRMASMGAEVVGIDFSPENIRISREHCPQCEFHEMDFRLLDSRYGMFDGIFASASLIHIDSREMPRVAGNLRKVSRGNARLLTLVKDGKGNQELLREAGGKEWRWRRYLYTKEELAELLKPFRFLREGYLAEELRNKNWRCCLWRAPAASPPGWPPRGGFSNRIAR